MARSSNDAKLLLRWPKMQKRGHLRHTGFCILLFVIGFIGLKMIYALCFRFGFMQTAGSDSWIDSIGSAILAGVVMGELDWMDMNRKFKSPPPEEDWMAK
ncbi:MAG TPA: hypothetical protein VGJ21_07475 [Terracidiphilus sp.]|jgi:hypothetical protein